MQQRAASDRVSSADGPGSTLEVHYKLFGTDGVSLQSQELSKALRGMGWRVLGCAADVPSAADGLRLPELAYQSADAVDLRCRLFPPAGESPPGPATDGADLVGEIARRAGPIRRRIEDYVDTQQVRVLHVRNLMSLPYHLPATLACYDLAVDRPDLGFLLQHHDLYWEGPNARNFRTPYPAVAELMDRIICPSLPNARHVLINPIAAEALRARKGIEGTVVPDGFDFERAVPPIDEAEFRGRLETLVGDRRPVTADDLVVSMPARVAINKAIELTIQFTAALADRRADLQNAPAGLGASRRRFGANSRVVLLLPQGEDLDDNRQYFDRLLDYARHCRIDLAFGGQIVVPDRRFTAGDGMRYPFYGTYRTADLVCYTPEHEGFGNQAIEAVWARRPLAVLEYPVFHRFVRDHLPHYISLGGVAQLGRVADFGGLYRLPAEVVAAAVGEAVELLRNHDAEQRWVDENFAALRAFCGIDRVAAEYVWLYQELSKLLRPGRGRAAD